MCRAPEAHEIFEVAARRPVLCRHRPSTDKSATACRPSLPCDGRASTRFVVQKHSHIHPIARHTLRVSNHREPSGWIDPNDFCRNEHVCFCARRGTCVAVGRYASGVVAYEWGVYCVNLGSARFRLESPRWFLGSSLNRQDRRQVRQTLCPVCVFRFLGQSTLKFSRSARR